MAFWQGDTLGSKIIAGVVITICTTFLFSFVTDIKRGGIAFEELQEIRPVVDSHECRISKLEKAADDWKKAASDIIDKAQEHYDRRAYRDSIRWAEATEYLQFLQQKR